MKVTIELQDAFSFAKKTVEKDVTEEQMGKLREAEKTNPVVWNEFDGQISWNWKLMSVKEKP